MATMAAARGGRPDGIGLEAATRSQTDEDLAPASLQALCSAPAPDRREGVEDEQRHGPFGRQPLQQGPHLLGADRVLVFLVGGTRSTSTGALQLSRAKPSRAMN
jgi:hypothetical protein